MDCPDDYGTKQCISHGFVPGYGQCTCVPHPIEIECTEYSGDPDYPCEYYNY